MAKERKFLNPEAEVVCFYNEDIILTSDVGGGDVSAVPEWPPQNE